MEQSLIETLAVEPAVTWVFLFMIIYWLYCIFWGIKGARGGGTAAGYFIAGRSLPFWMFILAVTATSFSGWTFLGHPSLIYSDGLPYAYASLYAITIPFTGVLFLKRQWLLGRRYGFVTPGEMFAFYFRSDLMRVLVVVVALVFSVPYVGLQLRASGFLFNLLTDGLLGVEFGMWVLSTVVISYVATGGLRTVAQVDMLQAVLLALGIVVLGVAVLYFAGGWERLMTGIGALGQVDAARTPDGHSHYLAVPGPIQLVADGTQAQGSAWTGSMNLTYTFGLMGIMASPAFTMWAFASRSPAAFAPQQVWASALVMGFILVVFTAVQGMGVHLLGADQSIYLSGAALVNPVLVETLDGLDLLETEAGREALVPQLINLLGQAMPWLAGLLAVCALAAMQSTAASYMATAGGILTRDLIGHVLMPDADDRTQMFIGRLCTVAVVLAALVVATTATDALVLLGGLAVSYGFQMWPALIAVCYWRFLTRRGVEAGLVVGLVVVTLTESIGPQWFGITAWGRWPLTVHSAGWGIVFNLAVAVLVSLLTRDEGTPKAEVHALIREHAGLAPGKRRLVPLAWGLTLLWFLFVMGPGAVLGNTVFGDPSDPASWWFGMPSIWVWQILGWALGVALMWFLAYYMELATDSGREVRPLAGETPGGGPA